MTSGASTVERLRQFLRELTPEVRAMLLRELERGASGESLPGSDLILQELRALERGSKPVGSRYESPDRLFFQPLVPFLVDDDGSEKIHGRIKRSALANIWTWIERDLLPEEVQTFSDNVSEALANGKDAQAEQLVRGLQDRAIHEIEKTLQGNSGDRKSRQKLVSQLGGETVLDTLLDVIGILRIRDTLSAIAQRLPQQIKHLSEAELPALRRLFEQPTVRRPDVFPYALSLLFSRLVFPPHILRFAVAATETDSAQKIADTPFAFAVDMIVDEATRLSNRLAADLHARATADVCAGIKKFHDYARALASELDVSTDTRWTRRLAQLRSDTARLLRMHIDGLPGQVRRLLRPRRKEEIAAGSELDPHEVRDIESSLEILTACRMHAGELALNEITLRLSSELETCLDTATQALLDSIRQATPSDRPFRVSQLDAAVRFSSKVFGKRYAELLSKAADVAIQSERRSA